MKPFKSFEQLGFEPDQLHEIYEDGPIGRFVLWTTCNLEDIAESVELRREVAAMVDEPAEVTFVERAVVAVHNLFNDEVG